MRLFLLHLWPCPHFHPAYHLADSEQQHLQSFLYFRRFAALGLPCHQYHHYFRCFLQLNLPPPYSPNPFPVLAVQPFLGPEPLLELFRSLHEFLHEFHCRIFLHWLCLPDFQYQMFYLHFLQKYTYSLIPSYKAPSTLILFSFS